MVLQGRRSSSMACEAPTALALLASHTDVCNSVLECDHAALGKSASTCPGWSEPAQVRRLQSMFGAFRRTYAELLQQHPSIPLELHDFDRSRHGPPKTLDVVLSRCHEPLLPLARPLPAMLPDTPWRMRLIVYERCADSEDGTILPSLDVRDSVLHLTRIALQAAPAGAFSEHIRRTLGQGATAQSWQAADALLFIRMRLLDALSPAVPVVPPATTPATLATTHESVRLQEELLARLHKHWEAAETVRAAELAGGQRARPGKGFLEVPHRKRRGQLESTGAHPRAGGDVEQGATAPRPPYATLCAECSRRQPPPGVPPASTTRQADRSHCSCRAPTCAAMLPPTPRRGPRTRAGVRCS